MKTDAEWGHGGGKLQGGLDSIGFIGLVYAS